MPKHGLAVGITHKTGKKGGFTLDSIKHICGTIMIKCLKCNKVLCVQCDCFYTKLDKCCSEAKDDYFYGKKKSKIGIEEISDGNL